VPPSTVPASAPLPLLEPLLLEPLPLLEPLLLEPLPLLEPLLLEPLPLLEPLLPEALPLLEPLLLEALPLLEPLLLEALPLLEPLLLDEEPIWAGAAGSFELEQLAAKRATTSATGTSAAENLIVVSLFDPLVIRCFTDCPHDAEQRTVARPWCSTSFSSRATS
jgi:hypothetical protein